jgi:osmotically-inducible protein OsmY
MRRGWRFTGGFLIATGILGGTSALKAQSSYRPVVRPPAPPTPVIASTSGKTTSSSPLSTAEMQIELAWLTDPITFPYDLKARIKDGQLRVLGNVASQAVRDRALLLAGQYSTIPVLDKMQVQPNLANKIEEVSAAELQQSVMQALVSEIGVTANQFEVKAHSSGQVSIAGSVSTLEAKLAVSQSLRGVKGCVCVVNLLTVADRSAQPTIIASTEPAKVIQASLRALFTSDSPKKASVSEEKAASVWKSARPVKESSSKASQIADSSASGGTPLTPLPQRTQVAGSAVKTVSMNEKAAKTPQKQPKPSKPMAKDSKESNDPPAPLPEELSSKPLEGSNSLPPKAKPGLPTDRLQQEIARICGARASNIQVKTLPDNSVAISMECKNKADAERLSQQILRLPSLARFEVGLDVHYEP